jgi:hypothetical protein
MRQGAARLGRVIERIGVRGGEGYTPGAIRKNVKGKDLREKEFVRV